MPEFTEAQLLEISTAGHHLEMAWGLLLKYQDSLPAGHHLVSAYNLAFEANCLTGKFEHWITHPINNIGPDKLIKD